MDDNFKPLQLLSKDEKDLLDMLIDEGAQLVGTLDAKLVQRLYNRGLTYLEVPVNDDDYIYGTILLTFIFQSFQKKKKKTNGWQLKQSHNLKFSKTTSCHSRRGGGQSAVALRDSVLPTAATKDVDGSQL